MKTYRYYCIARPPMIGGLPHRELWEAEAFTERRYIPEIDKMACGWVEFTEELTPREVSDYKLIMQPREEDNMPNDYYNPEGYPDPTAFNAIKNITKEEEKVSTLIHIIKQILRLSGFELIRRIEIRSTKSGREYR